MTSVRRFNNSIDSAVCGSLNGDLYIFRFPAMFIDKNFVLEFSTDKIKKVEMSLTRGFSAHTSMIQCLELFTDRSNVKSIESEYIFSTSL